MEMILTNEDSEKFFYNALCNSLGYMRSYGIQLDYSQKEYNQSRKKLTNPCVEDVWMQMLKDGYKLTMKDVEGEGDMTKIISIKDVHERVAKTPFNHLSDMINENDDAITGDVIIQTVFYEDVIFG